MKACPTCGHVMKSGYRYCGRCGHDQESLSLTTAAPTLSVVSGPAAPPVKALSRRAKPVSAAKLSQPRKPVASRGIDPIAGHFGGEDIGSEQTQSAKLPVLPLHPLFEQPPDIDKGASAAPRSDSRFAQNLNASLIAAVAIVCAVGFYSVSHGGARNALMTPSQPATALVAPASIAAPIQPGAGASRANVTGSYPTGPAAAAAAPQVQFTALHSGATVDRIALRRDSERYYIEGGASHVVGQVTNVSHQTALSVKALTTFYDKYGAVLKTSEAPLLISAVAPGHSSPYHVSVKASHQIASETTRFILPGGRPIPVQVKRRARPHPIMMAAKPPAKPVRVAKAAAPMRHPAYVRLARAIHAPKPPAAPARLAYKAPRITTQVAALRRQLNHQQIVRQPIATAQLIRHPVVRAHTAGPVVTRVASYRAEITKPQPQSSAQTGQSEAWYPGYPY